jgi:molecular chaperone DnaK (HSP70)
VKQNEGRTVHSIGLEVHGGRAIVLIQSGSRTPVARAMTFTTVTDGQRAVEIRVVRCTAGSALPSGVIGRFLLPGLRTGLRGEARIDIGISLDREGLIRAWGADRATGARQEATFAGLWALAPQERPSARAELARRVDNELSGVGLEDASGLRDEAAALGGRSADGPALAALAGEINSIRRSTAEPPVRI